MMVVDVDGLSRPERLLWGHGVRKPEHIDLEAIAGARGAHVVYRRLDGCAARLVAAGDRAVISVAVDDSLGRRRFSLGHELAHWMQDAQRTSFKCTSTDIGPQNAEAKTIEADANSFASQLILPDYLVWPWVADRRPSLDLANAMGGDFHASLTASALKLLQRAKVPIAITCHDQRRLKWSRRSRDFSTDFYILNELHQDTIAFEMAFGVAKGLSRPKRESASRWISGPGTYRMEVWSQSIKLPEGSVLSMLSVA
ncbi:ImmA/IrrE family metallo-endopeptidase [Roseateles oligotrophus]|uniref:ImmA/IrrE family metallo-endopeptidase n=1 Tax=Roseateles oligotrophus TaxID=1769250 RepID=A0ABT2YIW8_9BURK|nr:ImmA/IrrE family metallo-endopeptidase [Roseateles oligotrophus]MCV2370011.1 ImmA/IrrE family metallo-endopeptidase [Roseateles oligotrophus]